MKRGVILKVEENHIVVLTPDGEFRSIAKTENQQWQVGDEIPLPAPEPMESPLTKNRKNRKKWHIPAISIAATMLLVFATALIYSVFGVDRTAVAYVHMDMNPSIEMSVNESLEVLSVIPHNEQGEDILDYVDDWSHKSLRSVSLQMFHEARNQGYIEGQHDVLVATTLRDDYEDEVHVDFETALYTAIEEVEYDLFQSEQFLAGFAVVEDECDGNGTLAQCLDEDKKEELFNIYQVDIGEDMLEKAKEQNLSPGKYALYQKAREQGVGLELDDIHSQSVSDIVNELSGAGL